MAIKEWKEDPAYFSDLTDPIVKAIKFAYKLSRKNLGKDIPYSGYDRPSILGTNHTIPKCFSAENLKYQENNQGISALDEIIAVAVQLGIEQGRRIYEQENSVNIRIKDILIRCYEEKIKILEERLNEKE